uniref:Pyrrolo-quinoline quinone repeat domain-containing protein n=1 Tax=Odontella aurita TaxID=265563 RepID=A0A7S4IZW6_9STRA|mmetsp:Transcript_344/g.1006  ORF Transcript_344/g.1006 Transcript_344/m.1006 type:complete len:680 (+) Transcript_344:460-2499(+)
MTNSTSLSYYDFPLLRWSVDLRKAGGLIDPATSRHNAVQISPDDKRLYVTTNGGTLYVLKPDDGIVARKHVAEAIADGWDVRCESGISFYDGSSEQFLVYSLTDIPPNGSNEIVQSRIISVRHPQGSHQWISKSIPGRVSGTPTIGSDGSFVYFTHNTDRDTVGHFTMLFSTNGDVFFTESSSARGIGVGVPYAPLALAHNPSEGNFNQGAGNANDLAIWGYGSSGGDQASEGGIMSFQLPVGFSGMDRTGLGSISLQSTTWSTISKPTLSGDGQSLFFSVSKASLRGWRNKKFSRAASWKRELTKSPKSNQQPLFSSASLSRDEKRLFSASASTSFHAINAETGIVEWSVTTYSDIVNEARVSPDDKFVYTVERGNGKVTSYNTTDGRTLWSADCSDFHGDQFCQYSVEADFSVSSDGCHIYYGDIHGTVTAFSVGYDPQRQQSSTNDTSNAEREGSPGIHATTSGPSSPPSIVPSIRISLQPSGTPTVENSVAPSAKPTVMPTSAHPSPEPSHQPTAKLSTSKSPQRIPTSLSPTELPTIPMTHVPTNFPHLPTSAPSISTSAPSTSPRSNQPSIAKLLPVSSGNNNDGSAGFLSSQEQSSLQKDLYGAPVEVIVVTAIVVAAAFVFVALLTAFIVRLHINHKRKRVARTLEISAETDAEHIWPDDDDEAIFSRVSC